MKFGDTEIGDDVLVTLWHGEESMQKIAERHGVTAEDIARAFRFLKRNGRLPRGDRPRLRRNIEDTYDGRPKVDPHGVDPLVEMLNLQHKERKS